MKYVFFVLVAASIVLAACSQNAADKQLPEQRQSPNEAVPQGPSSNTPPVGQSPSTDTQQPTEPAQASPSGYSMSVVASHNSRSSCWTVVNGEVYDVTSYVDKHPGGAQNVLRICGKDGTGLFEDKHGGESKPERVLAGLKIGSLS